MIYNIYMARNLATLRKNIYTMLSHANEILALYYAVEVYREKYSQKNKKYYILII